MRRSRGFRDGPNVPWASVLSPIDSRGSARYDRCMNENLVEFAVVALLGVVTALACTRFLSAPRNKPENREGGYQREENQKRDHCV